MSGQWPEDAGHRSSPAGSPERRRPRWGLRTLGFLGLAFLSLVVSLTQGYHTFGTFGSLLFGLIGAGYCSVKGMRVALDSDLFNMVFRGKRGR